MSTQATKIAIIGASVVVELFAKDPALSATVWLSLMILVNGLGGGNEIVGGVWVLDVSKTHNSVRLLCRRIKSPESP